MKIEKKIALFLVLFGIVPLFIVSYLSYYHSKESIKEEVLYNLDFIASSKVLLVEKAFENLQAKVQRVVTRKYILEQARGLVQTAKSDPKQYRQYKQNLDILSQNYISLKQFLNIYIMAPDGEVVYSVNGVEEGYRKNRLLQATFHKALVFKQIAVSRFISQKQGKPYNYVIMPIVDKNNTTVALLCVKTDIEFLYEVLMTNEKSAKTLEVIMAQPAQDGVTILNPLRFRKNSNYTTSIACKENSTKPVCLSLREKNGYGQHYDYRTKEVLVVWQNIPKLNLMLLVKQDIQEAYGKIENLRYYMYLIFGLAIVFALYIFLIIMKIVYKLQEHKQRYETAIDGANEGLWEWDMKQDLILLSSRAQAILEYGSRLLNGYEDARKIVHKDDFEKIKQKVQEAILQRKTYKMSYRIVLPDGSIRWILDRGKVLYNQKGAPQKMIGFFTDITHEKTLEQEIRKTRDFFELILDNFPYMVVIKDSNNTVLYANKTAKEFVSKEMVGKNPLQNIGSKAGKKVLELSKKTLQYGQAEEVVSYEKDGEVYYFHAVSFLIPKEKGQYLIGSTYYNVTEHEKAKFELKTKDELMIVQSRYAAMGEMIGMIAHQWRQPIAAIAMDVNNMLVDIELENVSLDEFGKDLEGILAQTKHLSNTIDDFRNFFKPDKAKEDVLVGDVLKDALKIVGKSLQNNHITVVINNNSTRVQHLYARELLQVFLNLLSNAKDATLESRIEQRKITITMQDTEEYTQIIICDNGGGIKDDIIHKIFEPYFSTKKQKQGTGIGLYMSKIIVDKHLYGTIEAYNQNDGACFELKLFLEVENE